MMRNSKIDDLNSDLSESMKIAKLTNNEDLNDYMDESIAIVAEILKKDDNTLPTNKYEIRQRNSKIDDLNSDLSESMKVAKSTNNQDLDDYMDESIAIVAELLVKQKMPAPTAPPTPPPTAAWRGDKVKCVDVRKGRSCPYYAGKGYCGGKYKAWMSKYCACSCSKVAK